MPCGNHPNLSGSSCVDCVISDLLALDPGDKKAKTTLAELQRRFEKLDLSEDQRDLCTTLIAHVNGHLLQGGLRFGELIHPNQIRREDRLAYRARLRTMGTWIGFYEFTVLAEIYGVGFYIAMPASARNRWRRYPIGDGPYQQHMVLRWSCATPSSRTSGAETRTTGPCAAASSWASPSPGKGTWAASRVTTTTTSSRSL